jgi:hypothetical protein
MRLAASIWLIAVALCAMNAATSAVAQQADHTRGVDILNLMPEQPANKAGANMGPSAATVAPAFKFENSAGLALDILPDVEFRVGAKITFRVSVREPGYLVVVDIDAIGKLRQIYLDPNALLAASGGAQRSNHIDPGEVVSVTNESNPQAGVASHAAYPAGIALVVAILSDRPVQVLDLPDIPTAMVGRAEALKFLSDSAHSLRIARNDAAGRFAKPKLSFAAKFYVIKP